MTHKKKKQGKQTQTTRASKKKTKKKDTCCKKARESKGRGKNKEWEKHIKKHKEQQADKKRKL